MVLVCEGVLVMLAAYVQWKVSSKVRSGKGSST